MKNLKFGLIFWLFFSFNAFAASEEAVNKYITSIDAKQYITEVVKQTNEMIGGIVQSQLQGKRKLNPEEQKAIDNFIERSAVLVKSVITWEKIEPTYKNLLQETFTDEELNDISEFYQTKSGKSLLKKMPQMMSHVGKLIGELQREILPEQKKIVESFKDEMKAAAQKTEQ